MTSVLIADDHALQRLGFRMLLESQPDLAVAGEAANGLEAVRLAAELHPDVVLMDIRMPGLDGIEATRRITNAGARPRVLILTTFDLDEYAFAGLRAGASGFLVKDAQPTELLAVVAPALTRRLIEKYAHLLPARADADPAATDSRLSALTDREREVLRAIALGWTNSEIADRLHLAESTVKTHIGRILAKVDARDRVQAVIFAYDTHLVRPS
jgi:DNA-binding NarL/FixJ family response regulator